jgi:hypothetical protein
VTIFLAAAASSFPFARATFAFTSLLFHISTVTSAS